MSQTGSPRTGTRLEAIDDPYTIAIEYINWDQCFYLQKKKELAKESFEAKKLVFQSCGTEIANRERYQHNMTMDEEDSDSGEEN